MGPSDFVHLHVHSDYSLLDGAAKIEGIVEKAKRCGQTALALTDHGNLSGAVAFAKEAKEAGIKPIFGCEIYLTMGDHRERVRGYNHLTLLARSHEGWKNLSRLASLGFIEGFYYRPRISLDMVAQHRAGLIALSGCIKGPVAEPVVKGRPEEGRRTAERLREIFGQDFYLEVQPNSLDEQRLVNDALIGFSRELGVKLVATADLHYVEHEDAEAQEVRCCIAEGKTLRDESRLKMKDDFYFRTSEEMQRSFAHLPEAILSTREVADKVEEVKLLPGKYFLPKFFAGDDGSQARVHFRKAAAEGLARRFRQGGGGTESPTQGRPIPDAYLQRLEFEMGVVEKLGFVDYFLIVSDFIIWAKRRGIPVGPGRGSAAGSLVAWSLEITDLDPLKYDLLFERFLNPDRVSMPDIDIDFCEERRAEVIEYVRKKYGEKNVCQIVTFGTLKPKAAIRDVGRVLDVPLPDVDRVAKLIPEDPKIKTFDDAFAAAPELAKLRDDPSWRKLFDLAIKLCGINRNTSKHAAGVVISDQDLLERIPLMKVNDDLTTQFTMTEVEEVGLLKMDFLGLRTLTLIQDALRLIERTTGRKLLEEEIPLERRCVGGTTSSPPAPPGDDTVEKTFALLQRGETRGVFQLESSGFRKLLIDAKPDRFEDIVALLALYRPGPLGSGMDQLFINRKHGREAIKLEHPSLEPILRDTYGCFLYQEQVMILANKVAGFSLSEADTLRKAMGKKKVDLMEKYKAKFIEGCGKTGLAEQTATTIWDQIVKFAEYGFNKCVVGETIVVDADTGEALTVERLFREGRRPRTPSVDLRDRPGDFAWGEFAFGSFTPAPKPRSLRVTPRRILDVVENGEKPVFEVVTRGGRRVVATLNHPFLREDGWTLLEDLSAGDRVLALEERGEDLGELIESFASRTGRRGQGQGQGQGTATLASPYARAMSASSSSSSLAWDTVVAVVPRGSRMTYDLEIETTHNFIANGIVVHNSHSAAYGLVTYRTAWLKANYPVEFMAATLTSWRGTTDKLLEYIDECRRMEIEVAPPDVNSSDALFDVRAKDRVVTYGLEAIKGMGGPAAAALVAARKNAGRFRSLFHFCEEVDTKNVNKAMIEALVKAGAFASTGAKRSQLFAVIEQAMAMGVQTQKDRLSRQTSLFGGGGSEEKERELDAANLPQVPEWKDSDLLAKEKEAIGFYLTSHPLEQHRATIERYATARVADLVEVNEGADVTIGAVVVGLRTMLDKRQKMMAFATVEDFTGSCDAVVFGSVYENVRELLRQDAAVFIQGKLDKRREAPSIKVENVLTIDDACGKLRVAVTMEIAVEETTEDAIRKLRDLLLRHRGDDPVVYTFRRIRDDAKAGPYRCAGTFKVRATEELKREILEILPTARVSIGAQITAKPREQPVGAGR